MIRPEVTHRCPVGGSNIMGCCGKTPFEVPRSDRMTIDGEVTCSIAVDPSESDPEI